jgi:hypothetical protein
MRDSASSVIKAEGAASFAAQARSSGFRPAGDPLHLALHGAQARCELLAFPLHGRARVEGPAAHRDRAKDAGRKADRDRPPRSGQRFAGRVGRARPQRDEATVAVAAGPHGDPIRRDPDGRELVAGRVDDPARRDRHRHIEPGLAVGDLVAIDRLIGLPRRQALDLVAHDAGQELARLRRQAQPALDDLLRRKLQDDQRIPARLGDGFRQRRAVLDEGEHNILAGGMAAEDQTFLLVRHREHAPCAPLLAPSDCKRGEHVDPSSQYCSGGHELLGCSLPFLAGRS